MKEEPELPQMSGKALDLYADELGASRESDEQLRKRLVEFVSRNPHMGAKKGALNALLTHHLGCEFILEEGDGFRLFCYYVGTAQEYEIEETLLEVVPAHVAFEVFNVSRLRASEAKLQQEADALRAEVKKPSEWPRWVVFVVFANVALTLAHTAWVLTR